jgi:CDP-diglyceride synthetase
LSAEPAEAPEAPCHLARFFLPLLFLVAELASQVEQLMLRFLTKANWLITTTYGLLLMIWVLEEAVTLMPKAPPLPPLATGLPAQPVTLRPTTTLLRVQAGVLFSMPTLGYSTLTVYSAVKTDILDQGKTIYHFFQIWLSQIIQLSL